MRGEEKKIEKKKTGLRSSNRAEALGVRIAPSHSPFSHPASDLLPASVWTPSTKLLLSLHVVLLFSLTPCGAVFSMPAPRACHRYMVLLASLLAALAYANPNKCTCGLSAPTGIDLLTASPIMGGIVSTNDNLITTPAIVTGASRGAYTANEAKTFTLNAATFGGGIIHASAGVLSGWTGAAAVSLMVCFVRFVLYT